MKIVIIESPYAGDIEANTAYVRAAMRDSLMRGEAPYASHALYTQPGVLDDSIEAERDRGIWAGFAFRGHAGLTAFYVDRGVSRGMVMGARHVLKAGDGAFEIRSIELSSLAQIRSAYEALGLPMVGEL